MKNKSMYDWAEGIKNSLDREEWLSKVNQKEREIYLILKNIMWVALFVGTFTIIFAFIKRSIENWMLTVVFANRLGGIIKQQYRKYLKRKYKLN